MGNIYERANAENFPRTLILKKKKEKKISCLQKFKKFSPFAEKLMRITDLQVTK